MNINNFYLAGFILLAYMVSSAEVEETLATWPEGCAHIEMVRCEVTIQREAGENPGSISAQIGKPLCANNTVSTMQGGRIRWLAEDGISYELLHDSQFKLQDSELVQGQLFVLRPQLADGEPPKSFVKLGKFTVELAGAKSYFEILPNRSPHIISFKGSLRVQEENGRFRMIKESSEWTPLTKDKNGHLLSKKALRKFESDLYLWPAKKKASTTSECNSPRFDSDL